MNDSRRKEKEKAKTLRKRGRSAGEIAESLGVSKTTARRWTAGVEIGPGARRRLDRRRADGSVAGANVMRETARERREADAEAACAAASRIIDSPAGSRFISGLMLYWAEGSNNRSRFQFSNKDPEMIRFMMDWLREFGGVPEGKFRFQLKIYDFVDHEASCEFWRRTTGIPRSQWYKKQVYRRRGSKGSVSPYGLATVSVNSTRLASRITGWLRAARSHIGNPDSNP